MPKVKGWEKTKKGKGAEWINHSDRKSKYGKDIPSAKVSYGQVSDGRWAVLIERNIADLDKDRTSNTRYFETKEEAKDYAVSWIKDHPDG